MFHERFGRSGLLTFILWFACSKIASVLGQANANTDLQDARFHLISPMTIYSGAVNPCCIAEQTLSFPNFMHLTNRRFQWRTASHDFPWTRRFTGTLTNQGDWVHHPMLNRSNHRPSWTSFHVQPEIRLDESFQRAHSKITPNGLPSKTLRPFLLNSKFALSETQSFHLKKPGMSETLQSQRMRFAKSGRWEKFTKIGFVMLNETRPTLFSSQTKRASHLGRMPFAEPPTCSWHLDTGITNTPSTKHTSAQTEHPDMPSTSGTKLPTEQNWMISGQLTTQQLQKGPWQWIGLGEVRWEGMLGAKGQSAFSCQWRTHFSWWWTATAGFRSRDDYTRVSLNWHPGQPKKIGFQGQMGFGTRFWPELTDPTADPARFPNLLAPGFFHLDAGFWWGTSDKWRLEFGAVGGRLGIMALGTDLIGNPSWPTGFLPDKLWIWEQGVRLSLQSEWKKKKWQLKMEAEARLALLTLEKNIQIQGRWQWQMASHLKLYIQHQSRWDETIDEDWRHIADSGISVSW